VTSDIKTTTPQASIPPTEDARLPILEPEIEREWRNCRNGYVKSLLASGKLQEQVKETALWCISVLDEYQSRGLNPDQGGRRFGA
jgi:hypothetical protein